MSNAKDSTIPEENRPEVGDYSFDLDRLLSAVVSLRAEVPNEAFTAQVLGTERAGNGVVISDNGLVLTIGYLITEAETIWLATNNGQVAPAHVVGYDQASGFGLVQALGKLDVDPLPFGSIKDVHANYPVIIAGHGGRKQALKAEVIAKREFAGYWEYLVDEALFTAPAHPNWGGTACIGTDGRLIGIGSLLIQHSDGDETEDDEAVADGNMIVPVDLLPPILDDLLKFGQVQTPPRPWLGMFTADSADDDVFVVGLAKDGPADQAGIEVADVVISVGDELVESLADMWRKVWAQGAAGVDIPLTLMRDGKRMTKKLHSADRNSFLKQASVH
ncbi:MAG: S1C family serine protease [Geminicoccales bacterium]